MSWLYLALLAYFINAVAFVTDKHLLSSHIPRPFSYAFGVSLLSLASLALIPFGVSWYGYEYFAISFISGLAFFVALLFLYRAIKQSDVSVASTNVGALTAIFTYVFSLMILEDKLVLSNSFAFIFLVLGLFFMGMAGKGLFKQAFWAGIFMGLSLVLLKWSFNNADFINGVFWTRMGFVGPSLIALFIPRARQEIKASIRGAPKTSRWIFVANKFTAGIGFIVLYYAIRLGDVSLVNALLGTQFVFVLLLALFLNKKIPGVSENLNKAILFDKILGIVLIAIGFIFLFKK